MYVSGPVSSNPIDLNHCRFLLAHLHTDSLLDKGTPKDIKTTLARLLKGSAALDTACKDALQGTQRQSDGVCERAKKVLSWITFRKRPLTTAEICCALAIEVEEGEVALGLQRLIQVKDSRPYLRDMGWDSCFSESADKFPQMN